MARALAHERSRIFENKQWSPMKTTPCKREMKTVQLYVIQTEAESSATCWDKCFWAWEIHKAGNTVKSKQADWDSYCMIFFFISTVVTLPAFLLFSRFQCLRYILIIIMGRAIVIVAPLYSLKKKKKPRKSLWSGDWILFFSIKFLNDCPK